MTEITAHDSIHLLRIALLERNYTIEDLKVGGNGYTRFTTPSGMSWLTKNAHVGYPFTTAAIREISRNKSLTHELAASLGVQVPRTTEVTANLGDEAMRELLNEAPLVVKPSNASASSGVTLQVQNVPMLESALSAALAVSDVALVQSQFEGEEIRFTVFDGKVRAATLRQTPRLNGDGVRSVRELLDAENTERAGLELPYLSYPQLDENLIDLDALDMDQVLAAGQTLELSRSTMIKTGASVYEILEKVHPTYVSVAETVAVALAARFIVIDIMIQDYAAPLNEHNYVLLEINTSPALKLFYGCRDGKHYDILADLTALIDTL